MDVNDYLIASAVRQVKRNKASDDVTHREVVDQLVALKWFEAANQYLQPFSIETKLDAPIEADQHATIQG